jgi:hypothetical protein
VLSFHIFVVGVVVNRFDTDVTGKGSAMEAA